MAELSEQSRKKSQTASLVVASSTVKFRMAMETLGTGTRIELPVSLPASSGNNFPTELVAFDSVNTMFSGALRPLRSFEWVLS